MICNEATPAQSKGYLARQLDVPVVSESNSWTTFALSSVVLSWMNSLVPRLPTSKSHCFDELGNSSKPAETVRSRYPLCAEQTAWPGWARHADDKWSLEVREEPSPVPVTES